MGARLTATDAGGSARAQRTKSLDGMIVRAGAPTLGIALEDVNEHDTVRVFVNLR